MKKLIIVANDAEGIGKSTCAQACAELFKQHEIDHGGGGGTTTPPTAGDHGSVDRSALPVGPVD